MDRLKLSWLPLHGSVGLNLTSIAVFHLIYALVLLGLLFFPLNNEKTSWSSSCVAFPRQIQNEEPSTATTDQATGSRSGQGEAYFPYSREMKSVKLVASHGVPPSWTINDTSNRFNSDGWLRESGWSKDPIQTEMPTYEAGTMPWAAEYFLTLSLLSGSKYIQRVASPEEAEILFLPIFSTLKFAMTPVGQRHGESIPFFTDLADLLSSLPEWSSRPQHFLIPSVHPLSLTRYKRHIPNATFLVQDMYRASRQAVKLSKDIVVPLVPTVELYQEDPGLWDQRPILLYFKGRQASEGYAYIRDTLVKLLSTAPSFISVSYARSAEDELQGNIGMRQSRFCLIPGGNVPTSVRLFNSILSGCVPIIVSDAIELPFEPILDYTRFCVFIPAAAAVIPGWMTSFVGNMTQDSWKAKWTELRKVQKHFLFSQGSSPSASDQQDGPSDMIWRVLAERIRNGKWDWTNRRRRKLMMADFSTHTSRANVDYAEN